MHRLRRRPRWGVRPFGAPGRSAREPPPCAASGARSRLRRAQDSDSNRGEAPGIPLPRSGSVSWRGAAPAASGCGSRTVVRGLGAARRRPVTSTGSGPGSPAGRLKRRRFSMIMPAGPGGRAAIRPLRVRDAFGIEGTGEERWASVLHSTAWRGCPRPATTSPLRPGVSTRGRRWPTARAHFGSPTPSSKGTASSESLYPRARASSRGGSPSASRPAPSPPASTCATRRS